MHVVFNYLQTSADQQTKLSALPKIEGYTERCTASKAFPIPNKKAPTRRVDFLYKNK
jgi:hypothetical protein